MSRAPVAFAQGADGVFVIAIKRIMQEARELANDPCTDYTAQPLEVSGRIAFRGGGIGFLLRDVVPFGLG